MVALASVAGCSLSLSGPDSNRPGTKAPQCDTGKGLVTLDIVAGSILGTSALVALSNDENSVGAITGLLAAAFIGAAIHGNTNVNECRTALAVYNTQSYETAPDEPRVATARPRLRVPALPPTYVQPQGPPVAVVPPPPPVKTPRPARSVDVPADWRDFWTEVP